MSKLQFRKFKEKVDKVVSPIELRLIHLVARPKPAKREFIDRPSVDLFDMVCFVHGKRNEFQIIANVLGGDDFEQIFEDMDRLMQRAMIELYRRNDLTSGSMSYVTRLLNDYIPSDPLERAS